MLLLLLACSGTEVLPDDTAGDTTETVETDSGGETGCSEADHVVDADDLDGDSYGDPSTARQVCPSAATGVANADDCNDGDAEVYPGAPERCNGLDDDCDGDRDEGLEVLVQYVDADGDTYGDPATATKHCRADGWVDDGTDCDDAAADVYPGAVDDTRDGRDLDCDGFDPGLQRLIAGTSHACALYGPGDVSCWGYNVDGQATAPESKYAEIAAGTFNTCGMDIHGKLNCWGSSATTVNDVSADLYSGLTVGNATACALTPTTELDCWGQDSYGLTSEVPGGKWRGVSIGYFHACAISAAGVTECWGDNAHGEDDVPTEPLAEVSAGYQVTCGITLEHNVVCWGNPENAVIRTVTGEFFHVDVGLNHACALELDGGITCWGDDVSDSTDPPEGVWSDLSVGADFACARAADESVTCWGTNNFGQLDVP